MANCIVPLRERRSCHRVSTSCSNQPVRHCFGLLDSPDRPLLFLAPVDVLNLEFDLREPLHQLGDRVVGGLSPDQVGQVEVMLGDPDLVTE
jgi:hypothetical protein